MADDIDVTSPNTCNKNMDTHESAPPKNLSDLIVIAIEILNKGYVCDRCLGRAFSRLLHGLTNEQRGRTVRDTIALMLDAGKDFNLNPLNFQKYEFRRFKITPNTKMPCMICNDIFDQLIPNIFSEALSKSNNYQFTTFLVGTTLNKELFEKDVLLSQISPEYAESIKDEVNRTFGKKLEETYNKVVEHQDPELFFLVDLQKNHIRIKSKNIYIFGNYLKLRRGIPQTTWHCRVCRGKGCRICKWTGKLYKTSVQQIIEKPILQQTKSEKSSFHASGREDVDVRCLDYRPFVIEIVDPRNREIDLEKAKNKINTSKSVKISELKFANKDDIIYVKEARSDKTYHSIVFFEKRIEQKDLIKLALLKGATIKQKTPIRVVHRRADILRERRIKNIEFKKLKDKKLDLIIECDAGTYVKEFINGDNLRTRPNISEILGNKVKKIILDVVKINKNED